MLRFVVRRLLLLVPILLGLSILVFGWIRLLPGAPAHALLGERATPETRAQVRPACGASLAWMYAGMLRGLRGSGREQVPGRAKRPTSCCTLAATITANWGAFADTVKPLVLPAVALASIPLAVAARLTRAAVLDVQ